MAQGVREMYNIQGRKESFLPRRIMIQMKEGEERMKKFMEEFKKFISKGNVLDMAVGIIIGSAFTSIVNSLVSDIISPVLGLFGTQNLDEMSVVLKASTDSEDAVMLNYGSFISSVINFLIMALILFLLVKGMTRLQESVKKLSGKEEKKEEKPATKMCPYCKSKDLAMEATRCPHCTSMLTVDEGTKKQEQIAAKKPAKA